MQEPRTSSAERRFDGPTARAILERAAIEQRRIDREHSDSYTLEELVEIAAQARISAEALRAAVDAHSRDSTAARPSERRSAARTALGRTLLAGTAMVAIVGVLIAFPAAAEVLFWTTLVISLLVLLGASPF